MNKKELTPKGKLLKRIKVIMADMMEVKKDLEALPIEDKEWVSKKAEDYFKAIGGEDE